LPGVDDHQGQQAALMTPDWEQEVGISVQKRVTQRGYRTPEVNH
jgi:hypothetical protein